MQIRRGDHQQAGDDVNRRASFIRFLGFPTGFKIHLPVDGEQTLLSRQASPPFSLAIATNYDRLHRLAPLTQFRLSPTAERVIRKDRWPFVGSPNFHEKAHFVKPTWRLS